MGNCSFKGLGTADCCSSFIRILTDSGKILEFKSVIVAEVIQNYPGYGIFLRGHASASSPLPDHERLVSGQFYYLLPLAKKQQMICESDVVMKQVPQIKIEPPRMSTSSDSQQNLKKQVQRIEIEPPKMSSSDFVENLASGSGLEVLPSQGNGVWRVKLVINTKQLEEILSEEVNTEALIEQMRMAASSASLTPRRSKSSWVVGWKPAFSNVFKVPVSIDDGK